MYSQLACIACSSLWEGAYASYYICTVRRNQWLSKFDQISQQPKYVLANFNASNLNVQCEARPNGGLTGYL